MQALLDVLHDGLLALAARVGRRREAVDVDEHDEVRGLRVEAEEGQTTGDLLLVEVAGDELVEEVAGQPLLGLGDGLLLDQLERRHGDHVVQDDAVVLAEVAAVLDHGEKGADAVRGDHRVDLHARTHAVHAEGEVLAVGAAVADLAPEVGDELAAEVPPVGGLAEHDAVEVEEHRRAADQGRERREDGLEALLFEHDLGELLVHREAALQERVLLVDDLRGHGLGDGDERHVVGHLEQREAVLLGDPDERRRHLVEAEAGAEAEPGEVVVDEPLELLDLLLLRADEAVAGGEEELAALEPPGRVGDLGDVHPAHRVAGRLGAGQQSEVQVGDLEDVLNGDHRSRFYIMSKYSARARPVMADVALYVLARPQARSSASPQHAPGQGSRVLAVGDHRFTVDEDPVDALGVTGAGCSRTGSVCGYRLVARSRTLSRSKTTRSAARPGAQHAAVEQAEALRREGGHLADGLLEAQHRLVAHVALEDARVLAVAARPVERRVVELVGGRHDEAVRADHGQRAAEQRRMSSSSM